MMNRLTRLLSGFATLLAITVVQGPVSFAWTSPAWAQAQDDQDTVAEGRVSTAEPIKSARAPRGEGMVTAAHPLAVEAGLKILREGGSAVDAAVAVQAVLGLVEPQSSGLGGGLVALVWSAKDRTLQAYDGRETAPASAGPDLFLGPDGKPVSFRDAVLGGKSVGVPGAVAALGLMHEDHGSLPWKALFGDAERLARDGFPVGKRLNFLFTVFDAAKNMPATRAYFFDDEGEPWPVGHLLKNPAYAKTVRTLARGGPEVFYSGAIADAISDAVSKAPRNPAALTVDDIAGYQAKYRDPICVPYREWSVCGMPPPTSGGLVITQALGMLERFDLAGFEPGDPEALHLILEATKLAYADRDLYVADSDFILVPIKGMLAPAYLKERSALIDPKKTVGTATAGDPWPLNAETRAADVSPEQPGTSHFSVVDAQGNVVAVTTTIEFLFGSHLMANGFLLNNQLTDFSYEPIRDGRVVANSVQPGKRPRSSMAPTIVFDKAGDPLFAIGSPGGTRIPGYVLLTLVGVLDWNMSVQDAIALPRILTRNGPVDLEEGAEDVYDGLVPALEAKGHEVRTGRRMTSGLHGIKITKDGLEGGADPRREGVARATAPR